MNELLKKLKELGGLRRVLYKCLLALCCCIAMMPILIHAQELKVGVVDASYILENAPQSSRFREKLSSEFAAREREINTNRSKLRALQLAFEQAKDPTESDDISNKINHLDRDTARMADDFRQDYTLRINEELLKVQKEVSAEIIKYAEEERYDLILESGVFYVNPKLVVTEEILSRLK